MLKTLTAEERTRRARLLTQARQAALQVATPAEAEAWARRISDLALTLAAADWEPYPWQHPHNHPPGWVSERAPGVCDSRCATLPASPIPTHGYWLQRGGRGTGKTEGAAHYLNAHVTGPPCDPRVPGGHRVTIVAPTHNDAVASCVTGPSGLAAVNPLIRLSATKEGTTVRWPSGAVGRVLGAHTPADVDRFRAWTNVCCAWVEEAAAMVHLGDVIDGLPFTLRLGGTAHMVVTTTPKNRPEVRSLVEGAALTTWGRTRDAHRLDPTVRAALEAKFAGTTRGRQELDGEEIADVAGALWVMNQTGLDPADERPGIDNTRVPAGSVGWVSHNPDAPTVAAPLMLPRVLVSVDPSGGGDDEAGVGVLGAHAGHAYVLADLSGRMTSDRWARTAVRAYYDYGAEGIALEKYGGDQGTVIIRSVVLDDGRTGADVPVFYVPTKVGKRLRAEPVQAVYQQGRVHHVGLFPDLEDQMIGWVPDETKDSPDRVDWLVHGVTYLLVRASGGTAASATGRRIGDRPGAQRVRRM